MKKEKNKGFSLVELIVVIAIMATLVGVLAPRYIQYIERARRQTCYWNMDNVVGEVQLRAFSDPEFMKDLKNEAQNDGEVLDYIRTTNIDVPTCPSHGTYSLKFDVENRKLTMTCTMTVHNLPVEGGTTEGE